MQYGMQVLLTALFELFVLDSRLIFLRFPH